MAFLDSIFNPWLLPFLEWNPLIGIVIISFVISLLVTVVYKYATDQNEMKRLKDKQKEYQDQMKSLRDNPSEMMKVQKEAMSTSFQYMKHSFKPTLITMIPVLIIFTWMVAHLAYDPILPGESFSLTATFKQGAVGNATLMLPVGGQLVSDVATKPVAPEVSWKVQAPEGTSEFSVEVPGSIQKKDVIVGSRLIVADQIALYQHSDIEKISIGYDKLTPLGTFSLFGWYPGWLALYIFFSLVFSIVLRKVMKLY